MSDLPKKTEISLVTAAHRLGRTYQSAYGMVLRGQLKGRQIGARWYCDLADVERLERETPRHAPVAALA